MSRKIGDQNYDLGRFLQRGLHEISNALYPESPIPLRDHAGLYGKPPAERDAQAVETPNPPLAKDQPEIEL